MLVLFFQKGSVAKWAANQNSGDAFRLDVLKLWIFSFGKRTRAFRWWVLKNTRQFHEKIQKHGNQTLKRPIFVELKKGGSCSASFIPVTFINTGNPSPFFRLKSLCFRLIENVVNEQSGVEKERKVEAAKIFLKNLRADQLLPANMQLF